MINLRLDNTQCLIPVNYINLNLERVLVTVSDDKHKNAMISIVASKNFTGIPAFSSQENTLMLDIPTYDFTDLLSTFLSR